MAVNDIRPKLTNDRRDMGTPGISVRGKLLCRQRRESGTRIRHDIAHAGNREIQPTGFELQQPDRRSIKPTDIRERFGCR